MVLVAAGCEEQEHQATKTHSEAAPAPEPEQRDALGEISASLDKMKSNPAAPGTAAPGGAPAVCTQAEMDNAVHAVEAIVNQPVVAARRTDAMRVTTYRPGWFHIGAKKPDFNNVDVRRTQTFPYPAGELVTSNLNPGLVFFASELEFNEMTKYFYTNRNLPKKKLSDDEMAEINRLYRIIGGCERTATISVTEREGVPNIGEDGEAPQHDGLSAGNGISDF